MKKFLLGMFIVLCFAGISSAGDWGLYIGRVPPQPPCYPPNPYYDIYGPVMPRPYYYYMPPRAYEFGFFHHNNRDRYGHNDQHRHDNHRGRR